MRKPKSNIKLNNRKRGNTEILRKKNLLVDVFFRSTENCCLVAATQSSEFCEILS